MLRTFPSSEEPEVEAAVDLLLELDEPQAVRLSAIAAAEAILRILETR